ncbi:hypothetical protein CJD35_05040 [Sphingobium xenophagum]|uniref:Uncharacterized protein n=3 Tax=Alphaproteobacteria TaxID=28211 RepID=A0A249MRA4_SPHXE|nr:hypothetical protein CJD35_05040 [Sphingobium xenophagum]
MDIRPDVVGCYHVSGKAEFFPARYDELERQAVGMARVLQSFRFAPGSVILTVSSVGEVAQFAAFEKAIQITGHYGTNAEASMFDAGRVEAICRQFAPTGIFGVDRPTLEGLRMFGHDPARVLGGRTVWARPDAMDELSKIEGVDLRRLIVLGPTIAFECAKGGLHFPSRDWSLEGGETLSISSRMPLITPLQGVDTGVRGVTSTKPCRCGSRDLTIQLEDAA